MVGNVDGESRFVPVFREHALGWKVCGRLKQGSGLLSSRQNP